MMLKRARFLCVSQAQRFRRYDAMVCALTSSARRIGPESVTVLAASLSSSHTRAGVGIQGHPRLRSSDEARKTGRK